MLLFWEIALAANVENIAIFNSCDGLGLAQELADLHIPQMIVIKEPVPDKLAQEFLKYFLNHIFNYEQRLPDQS